MKPRLLDLCGGEGGAAAECDEALVEAQTALTGLRYSGDMERIEQAERDAASARDHLIRTARKGS